MPNKKKKTASKSRISPREAAESAAKYLHSLIPEAEALMIEET